MQETIFRIYILLSKTNVHARVPQRRNARYRLKGQCSVKVFLFATILARIRVVTLKHVHLHCELTDMCPWCSLIFLINA